MIPPSVRRLLRAAPLLCALLGLMTVAAIALLAGGGSGDSSRRGIPGGLDADRPEVRQALASAQKQRQRLASPQARHHRERSRMAYSDLSAAEALRVGRRAHRSVLRDRVPRPLEGARRRGLSVVRFPSPYAAVLRQNKGAAGSEKPGLMAMSTMPMRSRDAEGQLRLVNLEPGRVGDVFVPDNARIKLSIGDRASDGVKILDRGISIVPLDVSAARGVVSADAIVFANSAQDSDHIVRVTPAGADSLVQLRSNKAPTRFRYRVDLSVGGALRETSTGDIAVSQAGRRVGTIIKPTAWDADQRAIPVTTTLAGDVLTLDVDHRGRDVRYPAMLDPNYVDILQYRWYTAGNNNGTTAYWNFRTNDPSKMGGIFGNYQQGNYGQTQGLYAGTRGNQILYNGTYGYWTFTGPGTTSVAQTEWTRLSHLEIHTGGPAPCIDYGLIYNTTAWRTRGLECGNFQPAYRLSCWDCDDRDGVSHDPSVKGAQFGTSVYADTIANTSDYVGEVTQYVVDPDDPTVSFTSQAPSGWTKTPTGTIAATGSDPGLGVQSMTITNAGTLGNSGCLDAGPCPGSMSRSASVSSLNLPDGNNTVSVTARDASYYSYRDANGNVVPGQHQTTAGTPVKLDRTPPTITPSGTLFAARNGFVGPNQDYVLSVTATDGSSSPASAQRSGAVTVNTTLDGQTMDNGSRSEPCTRPEGSCALTINPTLTGAQIAQLDENVEHTVTITASDALGQSATPVTFRFRVDRTEPEVYVAGTLFEGDGATLANSSYTVDPLGVDEGPTDAPTAGIRSIEILVDGERANLLELGCQTDCKRENGPSTPHSLDTERWGDGQHEFEVQVTDAAGNVGVSDSNATFAGVTPLPPDRLSLPANETARYNGGAPGDRAGQSVANVGDVNGDGLEDTLVGAPGHDPSSRPGAGAAWLVLGSEGGGDRTLRAGETGVMRFAGPAVGDAAGTAVAAAGDVNGDGYSDMLIGAPGPVLSGVSVRGSVYVVFGGPTPSDIDLGSLGSQGITVRGPLVNLPLPDLIAPPTPKTFGSSLATRRLGDFSIDGDVNGDGLDDVVIGAADQDTVVSALDARLDGGVVYVVFGRTAGGTIDTASLGSSGYRILGAAGLDRAGQAVALPGDVNDDDRADVVVVAPNAKGAADRANSGIAYVTHGKSDSADVDLKTLGAGGSRVLGASADALRTAAGPGDIDSDSTPDLLLGGTDATAVFLQPGRDVDLAAPTFAGYRMRAPSPTAGTATVSAAGDLDGDDAPDQIIGFPALNAGNGAIYAVRGKHDTTPLTLASLPGNRGTSLDGAAGSGTGGAIDALDADPDGAPTLRAGSPSASPSGAESGQVTATASATRVNRTLNGCQISRLWTFPYPLAPRRGVLPRCRRAQKGTIDVPAFSARGSRARYNANPACGATSPSCRATALGGGNARLESGVRLTPGTTDLNLVDSFGDPLVKLTKKDVAGVRLCFDVRDARTNTLAGETCAPNAQGQRFAAQIAIVGKSCMETPGLESTHWLMRIVGIRFTRRNPTTGKLEKGREFGVKFNELQGFVPRSAIALPTKGRFDGEARAQAADAGCGVPRKRRSAASATALNTIPSAAFGFDDRYVSNDSYRASELKGRFGPVEYGAYSNYQVPTLKAPDQTRPPQGTESLTAGADWAALAISSTGVSGVGYGPQSVNGREVNTAGGGLVPAIVPRGRPFSEYDRIAYADPNVRCGEPRVVTWVYGAANPSGARNHKMIGWTAIRTPAAGNRAC